MDNQSSGMFEGCKVRDQKKDCVSEVPFALSKNRVGMNRVASVGTSNQWGVESEVKDGLSSVL